jgi:hypothetical protein
VSGYTISIDTMVIDSTVIDWVTNQSMVIDRMVGLQQL